MPQNDPKKKDDGVKDTVTGWNTPTPSIPTINDIQKSNGTAPAVNTATGWGATQVTTTTADIAKQNGFVTNKGSNGWNK
jgi:hypothetical protein